MRRALMEAQAAFDEDEIPVGAIIVCKDRIISRAHNLTEMLTDVTAHAEMQAITSGANMLGGKYLKDCTLYVTVEPCATEYTDFPQIDKIRFPQIRSQLLPVLRRSEHFDFEKAKTEVKDFLSKILVMTESEKEYVREFNDKKYIPELLFEDKEMVNRIKFHPMALWKTRSR